ncbi:MAG: 16S rRNA (cytosine(1402)-N(4))-methyltransferase RsmH [Betaproteobacteria bacterium]|nr:16S rRNA (cytosine(1402)-N(4))-methyltransferase RsmH [Betaproteobacteria bacterium]
MPGHAPVLGAEAIAALGVKADGVYVDGTFGRGGHSRLLLDRLGGHGRLIALDRDPDAIEAARGITDPRFVCVHGRLSALSQVLDGLGVGKVDGVLMDLGVSSPQLDRAERGFSFRRDGPLDMRMDPSSGEPVSDWLMSASEKEIGEVVWRYGEERFAKQIARAIVAARARGPVRTTRELATIVAGAVRTREPSQDPATRTFQALRIHINQELAELEIALPAACERLATGGRLVVISFHSLEDRIVKHFMQDASRPPRLPRDLPVRAADLPAPPMRLVGKPTRPSAQEIQANPRARSAILRVAEKT